MLGEGVLVLYLQPARCAAARYVEHSSVGLANAAIASQVFCMVKNIPSVLYISSHILKGDTPQDTDLYMLARMEAAPGRWSCR